MKFAIEEGLFKPNKARVIGSGSSRGVNLEKFDYTRREEYRKEIRDKLKLQDEFVFGYLGRLRIKD